MKNKIDHIISREKEFDEIIAQIFEIAYTETEQGPRDEKIMALVKKVKRAYMGAHYDAITDALTGCFNKKHIKEIYHHQYASAKRNGQYFSLVVIDIDYLKYINDSYGHNRGDQMIKNVATVILKSIRESDLAFRYGGDEFVLFCFHNEETGIEKIAERIKSEVAKLKLKDFTPSVTVGYVTVNPEKIGNPAYTDLFKEADQMLYAEKHKRKPAKFLVR